MRLLTIASLPVVLVRPRATSAPSPPGNRRRVYQLHGRMPQGYRTGRVRLVEFSHPTLLATCRARTTVPLSRLFSALPLHPAYLHALVAHDWMANHSTMMPTCLRLT